MNPSAVSRGKMPNATPNVDQRESKDTMNGTTMPPTGMASFTMPRAVPGHVAVHGPGERDEQGQQGGDACPGEDEHHRRGGRRQVHEEQDRRADGSRREQPSDHYQQAHPRR